MKSRRLMDTKLTVVILVAAGFTVVCPAKGAGIGGGGGRVDSTQIASAQTMARDQANEEKAEMLVASGEYAEALDVLAQIANPSARVLNERGVAYEHVGAFPKARASYEEAIRLEPKMAVAYNNLATVFYAGHEDKKAEKLYRKAIKIDAKYASAYKNLGASYFDRRRYRQGSEAFEQAIVIDPDVFDRLGGLQVRGTDKEELIQMNYFLAQLCAKRGRDDAAIAYLNRAVSEGFQDYARLDSDKAFATVRQLPGYAALPR